MNSDYQRIERALTWLQRNRDRQPGLGDLAGELNLSPAHTQRLFKRWAGLSPKQFLEFLNVGNARRWLDDSRSVLETSYGLGLSAPARLHDQMLSVDAVTPGQYKSGGDGLIIRYGFTDSPFGPCLMALTDRGICHLSFVDDPADRTALLDRLRGQWPVARLLADEADCRAVALGLFRGAGPRVPLMLRGTNFQVKVWQALLRIPPGCLSTYGDLARRIGNPAASRAVGNAVGANPVAYLVPCHRVIRANGELGGYRWGSSRKRAMLCSEARFRIAPDQERC